MDENYATRADLSRVESKVDSLTDSVHTVALHLQSVRDQLSARDTLEKHSQVLLAEVNAARAQTATVKAENQEAWNTLKSKALWGTMLLLLMVSFPGLINLVKQLKGLVP